MQRLTKNSKELIDCDSCYIEDYDCGCCESVSEAIAKLAEYEDLEEQGLLIKLPCKVGAPVWTIMCSLNGKNPRLFRRSFELSMLQHLGNAVFLTKEEAEAKLKEMEE